MVENESSVPCDVTSIEHVMRFARTLAVLLVSIVPALASAQARVNVVVQSDDGTPREGRVVLEANGQRHQCRTEGGRCSISGVPGGRYTARFTPNEGAAPPPRAVVIPPSGDVELRIGG